MDIAKKPNKGFAVFLQFYFPTEINSDNGTISRFVMENTNDKFLGFDISLGFMYNMLTSENEKSRLMLFVGLHSYSGYATKYLANSDIVKEYFVKNNSGIAGMFAGEYYVSRRIYILGRVGVSLNIFTGSYARYLDSGFLEHNGWPAYQVANERGFTFAVLVPIHIGFGVKI